MEALPPRLVRAAVHNAARKAAREKARRKAPVLLSPAPTPPAAPSRLPLHAQARLQQRAPVHQRRLAAALGEEVQRRRHRRALLRREAEPAEQQQLQQQEQQQQQLLHPSLAPETLLCVLGFLPLREAAALGLVACAAREAGESHAAVWHALCRAALREHPFLAENGEENAALVRGGAAGCIRGGWRALFRARFCPAGTRFRGAQLRAAQHELAALADVDDYPSSTTMSCRRAGRVLQAMPFGDDAPGERAQATERVWFAFSTLDLKVLLREDEQAAVARALAGQRSGAAAVAPGGARLRALLPVLREYAHARLQQRWQDAEDCALPSVPSYRARVDESVLEEHGAFWITNTLRTWRLQVIFTLVFLLGAFSSVCVNSV